MIDLLRTLVEPLLSLVKDDAVEIDEYSDRIRIEAQLTSAHVALLKEFRDSLQRASVSRRVTIFVGGESVDLEDEFDINDINSAVGEQWQVQINKAGVVDDLALAVEGEVLFFVSLTAFHEWIKKLDPLSSEVATLVTSRYRSIYVAGIDAYGSGPMLTVRDLFRDDPSNQPKLHNAVTVPGALAVSKAVRLIGGEAVSIDPSMFWLDYYDESDDLLPLISLSAYVNALSLASEVEFSSGRVVINGVRRIAMDGGFSTDWHVDFSFYEKTKNAVRWVYDAHVDTRLQLFSDRLSLDVSAGEEYLSAIRTYIDDALEQSKSQYRFVVLNRKDEYEREVRDLLKDVHRQSELYAIKLRQLLGGLLRDVLAALLLVGIGVFSRMGTTEAALESSVAAFLFKALAVYLASSALLQISISWRDVSLSKAELKFWANATRNYMSRDDLDRYLDKPLSERRFYFYFFGLLLTAVYAVLAIVSWNFVSLLECLGYLE